MTDPAPTDEQIAEWVADGKWVLVVGAPQGEDELLLMRTVEAARFVAEDHNALAERAAGDRRALDEAQAKVAAVEAALLQGGQTPAIRARNALAALAAAQPTESAPLEPSPRRDEPRIGPAEETT